MFDMTLDEENDFLDELLRRSDIICGDSRPDEDCPVDGYVALTCPKCHRGKIQTTCMSTVGTASWSYGASSIAATIAERRSRPAGSGKA
ncbi:hypothetical protein [Hugonella massiliensis]|uniref:hypothetical protein n=1 Tax=Hugonella massiliensis TaxID=1720315 RepID=UPI00073E50C1|nr:hypothetical protein [Hugonella massiliensis]